MRSRAVYLIYYWLIKMLILLYNWCVLSSTERINVYLPQSAKGYVTDLPYQGGKFNMSLIFIDDRNITYLSDVYRALNDDNVSIHLSFLSSKVTKEMGTMLLSSETILWAFQQHLSHLKLETANRFDDYCQHNYKYAMEDLLQYLQEKSCIIITTNDRCILRIVNRIIQYHENTSNRGFVEHFIIHEKNLTENITNIVYYMKLKSVDSVINILPSQIVDILFQASGRYGLVDFSRVWVTLEYNRINDFNINQAPWQWLNIRRLKNQKRNATSLQRTLDITMTTLETMVFNRTREWAMAATERLHTSFQNSIGRVAVDETIQISARNASVSHYVQWVEAFEWNKHHRLKIFPDAMLLVPFIRRSSKQVTLKIVTIIDPPLTMYAHHLYNHPSNGILCKDGLICRTAVIGLPEDHPDKWEKSCCIGMAVDLLLLIVEELHFNPDLYVVEDGFYGAKSGNSKWNGLIRDIMLKKADIAVAALTTTSSRFEVVDFCEPFLLKVEFGIIVSTMINTLTFFNLEFLSPLSKELKIWTLVTFIIGTILIYVLENQHLALKRITDKTVFARYQWREGFSYFSGLTFQRDLGGKNPKRKGARVTAIAFAFGMVIIMTTYTAVLTASKVSQATSNPFMGFKDKRVTDPSTNFKYATVSHSSMESYFKNSKDEVHKRMYQFMRKYNVNQSLEGIRSVKEGKLQAFIHEWPFLQYHASKDPDCKMKIFGNGMSQSGYAFSVPKNSPWKHVISHSILRLKEKEAIEVIYNKWFPSSCTQNNPQSEYEGVKISYFSGMIFILFVFLIITVGLLGLEHFIYRHHRRVINPIQEKIQAWRESKAGERRNAIINSNDINYLQSLHNIGFIKTDKRDSSNSTDDDISEGEEEIIRMRFGRFPLPQLQLNGHPAINLEIHV